MKRLRSGLACDRRGSVTLLTAAALAIATAAMALAVDLGSLYAESRKLQGIADAAALSAAGNLSTATTSAQAAIDANNPRQPVTLTIVTGVYSPDPTVAAAARFTAGGTANAARVTLKENAPLYFGRIFGLTSVHIGRNATAVRTDLAAFSLGSRAASLNGGIGNQLLSALTGSTISLSVADYNALATANFDLFSFVDALRTELKLTGLSYTQVLQTTTTLPHLLNALAATLTTGGNAAAASAVAKLAGSVVSTTISPALLVNLGSLGAQDRTSGGQAILLGLNQFLQATLQTAGGARQMSLSLNGLIPGLASVNTTLAVGNRTASSPWLSVTSTGDTIVSTAQSRLYLEVQLLSSPALQLLGISGIRLPVYVELAAAQARLSSISCSAAAGQSAILSVLPSLGHASIADVNTTALSNMSVIPAETPATIVNILGIKATASATIPLSDATWQSVPFNSTEIAARAVKTVSSSGTVSAIATGLDSKLAIGVAVGPLSLPDLTIGPLIKPILDLAAPLVDQLLSPLLDLLGIHLGQADVQINGVRCGTAALVA
ncbi:TadG family pilus assembly protein [Sphingomonas nostoxanthinifaciens]|uniref:TadG family pilus assembly protein n=1 Tax=Sphingomonas nostoxanthinifaciens TaxID=2872652 RepID=UPI001CC1C372|nr:TadG family pilus assembly protein [Sphingomonas nostoxanthinifaciens]UAK26393.1 hypothetical protein K8P63_10065 [Sphingomonas nostoxanthinifaciens]